jgi:sigma-B regulation protein RsbU (phosphoserine phosphatase)
MFVTFFLGVMELKSGIIHFCNAGHNYPYILKKDKSLIALDQKHGVPLGLFSDRKYESGKLSLEIGDSIILYTDGITEAENKKSELFGENRLEDTLGMRVITSAKVLTNAIISSVENFVGGADQSDDLTVLVIKRRID